MSVPAAAPNRFLEFWRLLWTTETTAHIGSIEKEAVFELYKSKSPTATDTKKAFVTGLSAAVELVEQRIRNKSGKQVRVWVVTEADCPADLVDARRLFCAAKEEEQAVAGGLLPTGATCEYPSAEWEGKWDKDKSARSPLAPGTCPRRPTAAGYCVQHHYTVGVERMTRWKSRLIAEFQRDTEKWPLEATGETNCREVWTRAECEENYANPDNGRHKAGSVCNNWMVALHHRYIHRYRKPVPDNVMCEFHGVKTPARAADDFAKAEEWERRFAAADKRKTKEAKPRDGDNDEDAAAV